MTTKGIEVKVGHLTFTTKSKLTEYCREILNSAPVNRPLNSEHTNFLLNLLRFHPSYRQKIGCGVDFITVQVSKPYNSRGFWLYRKDGTFTDFSFVQCINPSHAFADFNRALRTVVEDQVIAFKNKVFAENDYVFCPVDGTELDFHTSHVDHEYPLTFLQIVYDFIDANNINWQTVKLIKSRDTVIGVGLADKKLALDFSEYHAKVCKLRVVSPKTNLTAKKTKRLDRFYNK